MKRLILAFCFLALALTGFSGRAADAPDLSGLTASNHPRVIYTDADFDAVIRAVADSTNPYLTLMHETILRDAATFVGAPDLERKLIGKRLLTVSRSALKRITYCAYAYRTTGERQYLERAEHDIRTVCSFEDWNAVRHFLDAGEMAAAVGLAYDWLYGDLQEDTRAMARKALNDFAFHPALHEKLSNNFYTYTNNWNSVCNGGLVSAALAVYEDCPDVARTIIDKALESNVAAMRACYSPDGNYPEGYMYWNYGTMFETLLLTALETATGSDNGLSDIDGFSGTGKFMIHMEGPSGNCFNFSDGTPKVTACLPQWYFAWKFGDLSVLYSEKDKKPGADRLLPLFAWYASKVDVSEISAPSDHIFHGEGITPVVLVHETWTMDADDAFLGVKAGKANSNHGHMDAGTFVYDADGLRWASDLGMQDYTGLEASLKNIWNMKDGSDRWKVFRYNNFNHNTLTVNDSLHRVNGKAQFLEVIDSAGRRGAVVDISAPLEGEVAAVVRTIFLEGGDLVVEDRITALEDKPAEVRWTLVTPAEPEIVSATQSAPSSDGYIALTQKGITRYLTCSSSTGHRVEWKTWSAQSKNPWDAPNRGFSECGYTVTVGAGETAVLTVRLTARL